MGRLVILSGPSGVGKDTVIDAWKAVNPLVERVVATTTRPPREGETDGVDYDFVSEDAFQNMAAEGMFLEHKCVHGNWYGTPVATVERLLESGKIAILKIDVQGALDVMAARPDATSVFLLPPDRDTLEHRIRNRGTDDESTIQRRLKNANEEMAQARKYKHLIVNDQIDQVVGHLQKIVGAVSCP